MSENRPSVPDHELFGVIGRGAFGEVWLARNVMGIWRAVKVIRRSDFSRPESYEREFEAIQRYEPVARSTEGLVQVLHVGRSDALFYYVMELADPDEEGKPGFEKPARSSAGPMDAAQRRPVNPDTYQPRTLRSELGRHGSLDLHSALIIATALARGLGHLHGQGLVHRDVKPANVIFVHGRARLADMGLVDEEGRMSFAGTEGYVAPEGTGTPAADLYSLGLVLYEMTTGLDRKRFPQLPPKWLTGRDPAWLELHEVTLRACEGMPHRRYQSAAEMEADLAVISSGQSVRERGALARRSRFLKIAGAIATAGFVVASGWAMLSKQRVVIENRARLQAERLSAQTELALIESHLSRAAANRQTGRTGQRFNSLASIAESMARLRRLAGDPSAQLSPETQAALSATARTEAVSALIRVDLREIARAPSTFDRQWGIPADAQLQRLAVKGPSNTVSILALPERSIEVQLGSGPGPVEWMGPFSPDGQYLMVRYGNHENWVWDLAARRVVFRQPSRGAHLRGVFWEGGILVPGPEPSLTWQSLGDHPGRRAYPVSEQLMWLVPAADGEHLVGFTRWFRQAVWLGGNPLRELTRRSLPEGVVNMGEFAVSPDGRYLAIEGALGKVDVLCLAEPDRPVARLAGHAAEVVALAFHPDGRHLATSSWDGTTRIWDWAAGEVRLVHDQWTSSLRFSSDGTRCVFLAGDSARTELILSETAMPRFIAQWRPEPPLPDEPARKIPVRAAFSPNGNWLALGTAYGTRLLAVPGLAARYLLGSNEVYVVRFAPNGRHLFTAGEYGQSASTLALPASGAPGTAMPSVADIIVEEKFSTGGGVRQLTLDADGQPLALLRGMQASYRSYSRNRWLPIPVADRAEWMTTSRDSRLMAISETDCVRLFQTNGCAPCFGRRRFEAFADLNSARMPSSWPSLTLTTCAFSERRQARFVAGSPSRLVPAGEWRRLV